LTDNSDIEIIPDKISFTVQLNNKEYEIPTTISLGLMAAPDT
jgi:hypothetical protein